MRAFHFFLNPSFASHYLIMPMVGNLIPLISRGGDLENLYIGGGGGRGGGGGCIQNFEKRRRSNKKGSYYFSK